jgi:hypothetical protein
MEVTLATRRKFNAFDRGGNIGAGTAVAVAPRMASAAAVEKNIVMILAGDSRYGIEVQEIML